MTGLLLLASLVFGADVDRGPSGAVVTVRPAAAERVIVAGTSYTAGTCAGLVRPVVLPADVPALWGVNPEAYRLAVAAAVERDALGQLAGERLVFLGACQRDRDEVILARDACLGQYDIVASERNTAIEDVGRLKRQRVPMVVVSAAGGLVVGVLAVVGVAAAL
jgi:hypothetical protein